MFCMMKWNLFDVWVETCWVRIKLWISMCTCAMITVLCFITVETSCFSCYIKATKANRYCCTIGLHFQWHIIRVLCINYINKHQLKMAVAFLTVHAPVRGHLRTMGLFNADPSCRFCGMETETVQHITCSCEALSRQRYNVFGKPLVEP
jgi:hypothetical protein